MCHNSAGPLGHSCRPCNTPCNCNSAAVNPDNTEDKAAEPIPELVVESAGGDSADANHMNTSTSGGEHETSSSSSSNIDGAQQTPDYHDENKIAHERHHHSQPTGRARL
ncbi:Uu.00g001360.m01.CDS01 [Anthostomella pinea]|uniref:Uu.00g001360.m01.CDS01 n=1 Tax=Anthostomella pinea TaxID=933095 RepID=A0AAI8VJZ6_9PEZI|nr:Uu.00g001360.m01.CDS01 [Anthostomella pinea]